MIKAVLFDMDDTLLSINLTAFVGRYLMGKAKVLASIARTPVAAMGAPLAASYLAVVDDDRADGFTNDRLFNKTFTERTSIPLDDPVIDEAMRAYDTIAVPTMRDGIVHAVPRPGALDAIQAALDLGLSVGLATNPTFSEECVRVRMEWAGISDVPFARISHMGNSTRVKPAARYYQEFAAGMGLSCEECLMVGNDASRDLPRPDCGLATAYVGHGRPSRAAWRGDMVRLARELPFLINEIEVKGHATHPTSN